MLARADPEDLVLGIGTDRACRVDGQLDVEALLWMRRVRRESRSQVVSLLEVECVARPVAAEAHLVIHERLPVAGGRPGLERHARGLRALVESIPLDPERAADVRIVVVELVELLAVDLDRAVVARRCARVGPNRCQQRKSGQRDCRRRRAQANEQQRPEWVWKPEVEQSHGRSPSITDIERPAACRGRRRRSTGET